MKETPKLLKCSTCGKKFKRLGLHVKAAHAYGQGFNDGYTIAKEAVTKALTEVLGPLEPGKEG